MGNEEEYNLDIVTVSDEQGNEHTFEIADTVEKNNKVYVALIPIYDDPTDILAADAELIILEDIEENGSHIYSPIEEDEEFDEIAAIFESRLEDLYEIEPLDNN